MFRDSVCRVAVPWSALAVIGLVLTACGPTEAPVASLTVEPMSLTLPYPGYSDLRLDFVMREPLEGDVRPLVFVHLLDEAGDVVRTFDHELPEPWRPGSTVTDTVTLQQSALAPPLPAGSYDLTVGLYRGERRWPLETAAPTVDRAEYVVAEVTVPQDGSKAPMLHFSPSWMATEAGSDAQVLARRWLAQDGTLRLADIVSAGTLRLVLNLPEPGSQEDLVLEEGHQEPSVSIESDCGGGFSTSQAGFGSRVLEVPVKADDDGTLPEVCELSFDVHSHLLERRTLQTRSVLLEGISWRAQ
jgi:hypothetical protein